MCNELKAGDRIDLYEGMESEYDNPLFKPGKQRVIKSEMVRSHNLSFFPSFGEYEFTSIGMFPDEIKKIGTFIVKEVFTNRDPETII